MNEYILTAALEECKKAAENGYQITYEHEKSLNHALGVAKEKVQGTLNDFNSSTYYAPETISLLNKQLSEIKDSFSNLSFGLNRDLDKLRKNMSKFSITLFGRTMAGKSTLMEILTEGNGSSIGKGAQRTTRDIRIYTWNELEITDVPGIGAFEGEVDEQIAFEAAKTADLILFLITDDAPQAIEAECFSRIINLGKPVFCIINVKTSIYEGKSINLIKRDIQKKFDMNRLNKIKDQFLKYADQFGQNWKSVPFVYVHLKAAFLSQQLTNSELSKTYYQISKLNDLKERIIYQVKTRGKYIRVKTFVDMISNPLLESMENLLNQSQVNSSQGRTILEKKRQLDNWKDIFYRDANNQISSVITKIKSDLNSEIADFAEEHYSDENADKAWKNLLKNRGIQLRCQKTLEKLEMNVNNKLNEISREIANELQYAVSFSSDSGLRMEKITDWKNLWEWTSVIGGGGLSVAAAIALFCGSAAAGPLGWAALAVTGISIIGSFFSDSREQKEFEARTRLENKLHEDVDKICDSLKEQMENNLYNLIQSKIEGIMKEMDKINSVVFRLADTQRELAWELNAHLIELNRKILFEAIKLIGAEGLEWHIDSVARIPGNRCLLVLRLGTFFPKMQWKQLIKLMSEQLYTVLETDNKRALIFKILGRKISYEKICIEEKLGVAHVPLKDANQDLIQRARLAQQVSKVQIVNQ